MNSEEYREFAYVTKNDLNFLTSSSKIKPPFVIVEAPEATRVDYFIPKMANGQGVKEKGNNRGQYSEHMNDYRIIMESTQNIKMFMAEERDHN